MPTPAPQEMTQTASTVMIPMCPNEYNSASDYEFGAMVALPVDGSDMHEVYQCSGNCNAGPGHAPGSENGHLAWDLVGVCGGGNGAAVAPVDAGSGLEAKWYPSVAAEIPGCTFGSDYPGQWADIELLSEQFLFESEEACCEAYEEVCNPPPPP